jgi:putative transposase
MPHYLRAVEPGGTFFFTVVTHERRPFLTHALARTCLRLSIEEVRASMPFEQLAFVLLPDHLHSIWRLPEGDADFSTRWARIKKDFSKMWRALGGKEGCQSPSKSKHRERAVWQRRFWEHLIRDERDLACHYDYIHYNPVKHGLVRCVADWPWSSFHRFVQHAVYEPCWGSEEPQTIKDMNPE